MRVVTFASVSDGSIARIIVPRPAVGERKAGFEYLPVVIHAPTCEAARQKAEAFYASELERFAAQKAGQTRRFQKLAEARAAKAKATTPA